MTNTTYELELSGEWPGRTFAHRFGGVGIVRGESLVQGQQHDSSSSRDAYLFDYLLTICRLFEDRLVWYRFSGVDTRRADDLAGSEHPPVPLVGGQHPCLAETLGFEAMLSSRLDVECDNFRVLIPHVVNPVQLSAVTGSLRSVGYQGPVGMMVENPAAAFFIEDFLALDDVDRVTVDLDALSKLVLGAPRGLPGNPLDPAVVRCVEHVVAKCREHGVGTAIAGCSDGEALGIYQRLEPGRLVISCRRARDVLGLDDALAEKGPSVRRSRSPSRSPIASIQRTDARDDHTSSRHPPGVHGSKKNSLVLLSSFHDVGHRLIVRGLLRVWSRLPEQVDFSVAVVDKHALHEQHNQAIVQRGDLIVIAGGPVIWPFAENSDWPPILSRLLHHAAERGVTIAALGLGSCYPYPTAERSIQFRQEELDYVLALLARCKTVTVRDTLARDALREAGVQSALLPCPALCAHPQLRAHAHSSGILFNFMRGGGHHDYRNEVDGVRWQVTATEFVKTAATKWPLSFLCHSPGEYELASLISPTNERILVLDEHQYGPEMGCLTAINNRLHATIGLAALGIPSVTVGTDSRLLSAELLGLPTAHVNTCTVQTLLDTAASVLDRRDELSQGLAQEADRTFSRYSNILTDLVATYRAEPPHGRYARAPGVEDGGRWE